MGKKIMKHRTMNNVTIYANKYDFRILVCGTEFSKIIQIQIYKTTTREHIFVTGLKHCQLINSCICKLTNYYSTFAY